ncbi:transcriptional regulator, XRE family [Verminephrobacter eiseniae EF01-2]|uniref:Transcriptional regulator, XRE family n=2 Tax=Verminephrobacter eiseniae TaxID=364317 RepID=A1WR95_VEREI|nr:transcriptional regulator, XRE family [Verminephrobacter eiseniae EF01-2]
MKARPMGPVCKSCKSPGARPGRRCTVCAMRKTFIGVRLRRLREERGMNQAALAHALELSPSYLNQLEQNQRPLTVAVLLKINRMFGLDVQMFSDDDEARLISDLREVLAHAAAPDTVSLAEVRELAAGMPAVARTLIRMHGRQREALARIEDMALRLGDERSGLPGIPPMPYEEVRDFFTARQNHIGELDEAAERMAAEWAGSESVAQGLERRLQQRHAVRVVQTDPDSGDTVQRCYDPQRRLLQLSASLDAGQAAFQMATQLAFLEMSDMLHRLSASADLSCEPARALARIGLANYFAGALLLPYTRFLEAAEAWRYDIDRLGRRFGVGFETVCHRLSTLQRPSARAVPFFFVRVDRAGNISKRQSATHFHFSRAGGTCPLWNVYEAFAQPGRILTQLARMPDGRAYLWVARSVSSAQEGYGQPGKTFAIGLGCDIQHAPRLVYAKGLDLKDPQVPTPIGMGCKVCEREACPQRAFPFIGRQIDIDENRRTLTPYPVQNRAGSGANGVSSANGPSGPSGANGP